MSKVLVGWDWLENSIDILANKLEAGNHEITHVTGIPRGGLIPAVLASHKIGLKFIPYSEACQASNREQILLIDDICDTGHTVAENLQKEFLIATLLLRYNSPVEPHIFCEMIEDDSWIVFPWEEESSEPIQDYLVSEE